MNILDRYVMRAVLSGTLLVLLVLLALSGFINFIAQLDDVGTGSYTVPDALIYVSLSLTRDGYVMFPIAVLIGSLLGLGNLAGQSELIVMRAAGVSVARLAASVMLSGLLLTLLASALGEFIAPPAERYARRLRTFAMNDDLSMASSQSAWIKDGQLIINLESRPDAPQLGSVYTFALDDGHALRSVSRAISAGFRYGKEWRLFDVRETRFTPEGVRAETQARAERATSLRPELIALSVVDPDGLDTRQLYAYVQYLRSNALDAYAYEIAFWTRVAEIPAVLLMAALALPFVFGPLRSGGAGQRLMVGVLLGLIYYIGARTLASSGDVFDVNPIVIGWLPTALLGVLVFLGLARVR